MESIIRDYILKQIIDSQQMLTAIKQDNSLILTMETITKSCITCFQRGGKILLAGNGGSAAQAQHIAAEFVGRFAIERHGLSAIALTTDTSVLTSIGNDYGYEYIFARQLQALGKFGDVFIGFSTSGSSKNILRALEQARNLGMICVGMAGKNAGLMSNLCDLLIEIPQTDTAKIQEGHLVVGHILCGLVEASIAKLIV